MMKAGPRIAHLNYADEPGVIRKIREEARAAVDLSLPIDFYVIDYGMHNADEGNLHFRGRKEPFIKGKLGFLTDALFGHVDLIAELPELAGYDFYVLRFGNLFLRQLPTYRRHGSRMVTEHHSDELAELLLRPTLGRRFMAAVSSIKSRKGLALVAGIVGVTSEVLAIELAKSGPKPSLVLPNGVSLPPEPPPPRAYRRGEQLRIVFSAADFQAWQGLDRLVAALAAYRGETVLQINLAGRLSDTQAASLAQLKGLPRIDIVVHGLIKPEAVRSLYERCHLGVAALAISRIGMLEACPLKMRDYAAWGLPAIYSFSDPDIPADWPYMMRLASEPAPVDLAAVVAFVEGLYANGDPGPVIRAFAAERLDWKAKMRSLYDFVAGLYARAEGP